MQVVHQPARSSNDDIRTLTQACLLTTTIQSTLVERYAHEHSHTAHTMYACYQLRGRIPPWYV